MARYLVTGGAGFIGSHLVEALVQRGHDVRVVDDLSTGHRRNLADAGPIEFIEGNLADPGVAAQAVTGIDCVLHQAAIPSVPLSVDDPLTTHRANVDATLQLLLAARDAKVRRVVYAGSSSAYGDTSLLPNVETMPTRPLSPYALQKLTSEHYCLLFTRLYGLETVVIRYFNVFGPRQDPGSPYSGVISLFVKTLHEQRVPSIYGDGEQTRDFAYVGNVVDGVLRACEAPGASGEVINVSTGEKVTVNQLFTAIRTLMSSSVDPNYLPARVGEVRDSQADIGKARRVLGYAPLTSFEEGLRRTIDWYRSTR